MHWSDEAIVLSTRKHGENSAVVRVFSHEHGVYGGVMRGLQSKTNRGVMQPGNIINATWNARLSEHLGSIRAELLTAYAAQVMIDGLKISALSSACALIETSLPERHPYSRLYGEFKRFLSHLVMEEEWLESYIKLELRALAESGFGLDLSQCAATGSTENLIYVSPKSGRAVSEKAGEPYAGKLLPLPEFLRRGAQKKCAKHAEILEGLDLTGYFLEHWLATPHGKKLPAARRRLVEMIKDTHGKAA